LGIYFGDFSVIVESAGHEGNGAGFETPRTVEGIGVGLKIIRSRIALLNGTAEPAWHPGGGRY